MVLLSDNPERDDQLILRLQYDIAAHIHDYATIAKRYGFASDQELFQFLAAHPNIRLNIRKIRAAFESEEGAEQRVRLKAQQATEFLIAGTASIAADPRVTAQQRIDAFKQLARVGGLDGGAAAIAAKQANAGAAFTLNIHFRDRTETIATTVVDADELPAPSIPMLGNLQDEDAEFDEEV